MPDLDVKTITDAVKAAGKGQALDPRLEHCVHRLVEATHSLIRELELSEVELLEVRNFVSEIARTEGGLSTLLAALGIESLVDMLAHPPMPGVTPTTSGGRVYRVGAPMREKPAKLYESDSGNPLVLSGKATDPEGVPIPGAMLDVWQTNSRGNYDVWDTDQPAFNFRGRFLTEEDGSYEFQTVKPTNHKIPESGPIKRLLRQLGRHPWRAAHIHFQVSKPGYETLTTELFFTDDPYLESDAIFHVRDALVTEARLVHAPDRIRDRGFDDPFYEASFDFGLTPKGLGAGIPVPPRA